MAHLVLRSRKVLLGLAFVGVMSGSGGFLGAIVGVVLALLARSVMGINTGTGEFIAAWIVAGFLVTGAITVFMTLREFGIHFGSTDASTVAVPAVAQAQVSDRN